jgi:hypothetical protein
LGNTKFRFLCPKAINILINLCIKKQKSNYITKQAHLQRKANCESKWMALDSFARQEARLGWSWGDRKYNKWIVIRFQFRP